VETYNQKLSFDFDIIDFLVESQFLIAYGYNKVSFHVIINTPKISFLLITALDIGNSDHLRPQMEIVRK